MDSEEMWTQGRLEKLPSVPVPAGLERRILADFDRVTARTRLGRGGWLASLSEAVWPGAPVWRPATVLAVALVVGVLAGSTVPLEDGAEQGTTIALDAPPSFDLGEAS